jgi:pyridoxal 5'-phosphate synthase glutaminase subunit Pdx2
MLLQLGIESVFIRNLTDWQEYLAHVRESREGEGGLILPGGESTAMMRVMSDEGLVAPIRKAILEGLPVLGTCAGMILLDDQHLGCMDITVRRNAYGRQLGSFQIEHEVKEIGIEDNSLQKIYANLFGQKISKGQQLTNWEAEILTEAQQRYAATDAWACIQIHQEVARMKREQDFRLEKTQNDTYSQ